MKPITSKIAKQIAFVRLVARFQTPCGCPLRLMPCRCPRQHCTCELDIDFCEHAANWPVEFLGEVGQFLAQLDPASYADRPQAKDPVMSVRRSVRIAVYEARAESGEAIFSKDDCRPETRKNGERLTVARNGIAAGDGVGEAPDSRFRAAWRSRERKTAAERDVSFSVEELISASEE